MKAATLGPKSGCTCGEFGVRVLLSYQRRKGHLRISFERCVVFFFPSLLLKLQHASKASVEIIQA